MKLSLKAAMPPFENWYSMTVSQFKTASNALIRAYQSVLEWHKRQMITNPMYPITLLDIGKSLIRIIVPSAAISAAATSLLAALLGDRTFRSQWDWEGDQY